MSSTATAVENVALGKPERKTPRERGSGRYYQPKGCKTWWLQYYVDGKMKRHSSGTQLKREAIKLLQTKLAEVNQSNWIPPATAKLRVRDLFDPLIKDYEANERSGVEWARRCWTKHLEPHFGLTRAANVGTDQINDYIVKRKAEAAANSTIQNELAILRRMFYLAYESKPRKVQQVPSFPKLKEAPARQGIIWGCPLA